MAAHRTQLGQIEFEANDEHQEYHTKLTEVTNAIGVLGQRQSVGPDDHANHQVTQHGRQFKRAAGHHAQHGSQQIEQGQFQGSHARILARVTPVYKMPR